jgi:hypothetical protein
MMFYEPLSDVELAAMVSQGERLLRAVEEIKELRKELAAFSHVRRYLSAEALNPADALAS